MLEPTISFHAWLQTQATRTDPIGDVAVELLMDPDFPETYEDMVTHLKQNPKNSSLLYALDDAHKDYAERNLS